MRDEIFIPRVMSEAERVAHYARMLRACIPMPTRTPDWYLRATASSDESDTIPAPHGPDDWAEPKVSP